jgi:hypothetical protein
VDHIAIGTAGDLVRFTVFRKENVVAETAVENVSARASVQDIVTVVAKLHYVAD